MKKLLTKMKLALQKLHLQDNLSTKMEEILPL